MIDRFNTYLNNTYGYFQSRFKKLMKTYFFLSNYKKISNYKYFTDTTKVTNIYYNSVNSCFLNFKCS